jgi:hypothetical protein
MCISSDDGGGTGKNAPSFTLNNTQGLYHIQMTSFTDGKNQNTQMLELRPLFAGESAGENQIS